ncbi:MAG: NAD(+) synthase [Clostridia bacterium]|nr:NAD(+) synthase [Clostridia bacterium]
MENKNFVITEENVSEYCKKIGSWIKENIENAKTNGVVLGMSSGVDCSVVARLCQNAGINTHLILMPYGNDMTNSKSYSDAMELINKFHFDYHVFDIKPAVDAIQIPSNSEILKNASKTNIELSKANIRPRMRMTYLYQYAQINNLLVIGTSNLSERTVGYSTKWGDGVSDLNPLGMITKREVYILAKYLQVPECIINKKPSADLWEGQTDEEELGIKYEQIDEFILNGTSGDEQTDNLIKIKNERSMHKINPIPIFNI